MWRCCTSRWAFASSATTSPTSAMRWKPAAKTALASCWPTGRTSTPASCLAPPCLRRVLLVRGAVDRRPGAGWCGALPTLRIRQPLLVLPQPRDGHAHARPADEPLADPVRLAGPRAGPDDRFRFRGGGQLRGRDRRLAPPCFAVGAPQ